MRGFVHSARWEGRVRIFHCQEITRGRKFSRRKLLRSSEKRKEKALKVRLFWSNLRGMKQNYYNFILFSLSPLQQMYKISEQMMAPASLFGDSEPTRDLFLIYNEFFNTWHSRRSLWKARFNIKREMMDLPSIDPLTEKKKYLLEVMHVCQIFRNFGNRAQITTQWGCLTSHKIISNYITSFNMDPEHTALLGWRYWSKVNLCI